jgi:hypothetical protein
MNEDQINLNVRNLVRAVLGMPDGSVRPAKDRSPVGGQTTEMATVDIIHAHALGEPGITNTTDENTDITTEIINDVEVFVASVQFYKSATADSAGAAVKSDSAFRRAARLPRLLGLSANVAMMRAMGLGYLKASPARNLAALVDARWESRGSVDLTFNVVESESATVQVIETVPVSISVQAPDNSTQTRSFEVTS